MDIRSAKGPVEEKRISSNKNYTEALCAASFSSVRSTKSRNLLLMSRSETLFQYKLQEDIPSARWPIVEKGISPNKNYTEVLCETSF